jgi:hypothetical protein
MAVDVIQWQVLSLNTGKQFQTAQSLWSFGSFLAGKPLVCSGKVKFRHTFLGGNSVISDKRLHQLAISNLWPS